MRVICIIESIRWQITIEGSNQVFTNVLFSLPLDYDLLVKSKSNLLTCGSPNATTPNTLHSPLATNTDSKGSSPADNAAAAAAYHLSSMFRKPKRIRTAFSPGQLLRLEEIFEKNRYVVGCERKQLARDLNLSETQIKVWFQNRRTKHKRERVSGNGNHVLHQGSNYHSEDKKVTAAQILASSTSSSSASSMPSTVSNATYLSNGSFSIASSSGIYGSHFKNQSNTHRTLLAK